MVYKNKKILSGKLPEALWAYRTTLRIANQATPYSLLFGRETVHPLEKANMHLAELETLNEGRLTSQQNLEL